MLTTVVQRKEVKVAKVNPRQDLFCKLYATDPYIFGNATQCYLKAYETENIFTAQSGAQKMLELPHITARINEYLTIEGFNNENVDKQHLFIINQHKDLPTKMKGIQEYNKLKKRVSDRLELVLPKPLLELDDDETVRKIDKKNVIDVQGSQE